MVQEFTGFITDDGSKFACAADAHKHEIAQAIRAKFPAMLSAVGIIMDNVEWFATLLSPMAPAPINHPEPSARPPLGPCPRCDDLGLLAAIEPTQSRNTHDGKSIEGRRVEICPEIGCQGREKRIGPPAVSATQYIDANVADDCEHTSVSWAPDGDPTCSTCGKNLKDVPGVDTCPKGMNHDWKSEGLLSDVCAKCGEGRA